MNSKISPTFDHPSDGYIDDADVAGIDGTPSSREDRNEQQRPASSRRYMPIQADDVQRQQIEADPTVDPQHLGTLDDLKRLLTSDEEKARVFCGGGDPEWMRILNELLEVAIAEIEEPHATVVGVVDVLILKMLDISSDLRGRWS